MAIAALLLPMLLGISSVRSAAISPRDSAKTTIPARYTNPNDTTFLIAVDQQDPFPTVVINAIDGSLVYTVGDPTRICPCANHQFGAKNTTGYYVGGTEKKPTLQLYTNGPEQQVYVDRDRFLRYTTPGGALPAGANATSFYLFNPEPLGRNLPSESAANIEGTVTQEDGTVIAYNGFEFCPDGTKNATMATGPYLVRATRSINGDTAYDTNCFGQYLYNTVNDTGAGLPGDPTFHRPSEPLAYNYKN